MKKYIHSSYDEDYDDMEADGPLMYGYKFFSTMTGITIMFCHTDEDYLVSRIHTIYDYLMDDEEGSEKYQSFCDKEGIYIVDDEYGDLVYYESLGSYAAEIDGEICPIEVIAEDEGRF